MAQDEGTITLSIGGVEFCLAPDPADPGGDLGSMMSVSRIRGGEVTIRLDHFVGTLHVKNYNIAPAVAVVAKPPPSSRGTKRTASDAVASDSDAAGFGLPAGPPPKTAKFTRANHSRDDAMRLAVEEWDRIKGTPDAPSRREFARSRGIKHSTFSHYAHRDPTKRQRIGVRCGKRAVVSDEVGESLARHFAPPTEAEGEGEAGGGDEARRVATTGDVVDVLLRLAPELSPKQASNYIHHTWKRKHGARRGIAVAGKRKRRPPRRAAPPSPPLPTMMEATPRVREDGIPGHAHVKEEEDEGDGEEPLPPILPELPPPAVAHRNYASLQYDPHALVPDPHGVPDPNDVV